MSKGIALNSASKLDLATPKKRDMAIKDELPHCFFFNNKKQRPIQG